MNLGLKNHSHLYQAFMGQHMDILSLHFCRRAGVPAILVVKYLEGRIFSSLIVKFQQRDRAVIYRHLSQPAYVAHVYHDKNKNISSNYFCSGRKKKSNEITIISCH
jgi:hypothetical protein